MMNKRNQSLAHSIITFSQIDQNLDPSSPLVHTCSFLVIRPNANVEDFTPPPPPSPPAALPTSTITLPLPKK